MDNVIGRIVVMLMVIIAIAGIGVAARQMYTNNKVTQFATDVQNGAAAVRQYYSGFTSYATLGGLIVSDFPQIVDMYSNPSQSTTLTMGNGGSGSGGSGSGLVDPWGDVVTITSASSVANVPTAIKNDAHFVIQSAGTSISAADCEAIVKSVSSADFTIVGTTVVNESSTLVGTPIDPTKLSGACNGTSGGGSSGGSSGAIPITFVFSH